jgi:hypothetical protein
MVSSCHIGQLRSGTFLGGFRRLGFLFGLFTD